MSKVWNDEKIFEIRVEKINKKVSPNEEYSFSIKKYFDEEVKMHFKDQCDFSFAQNPIDIKSHDKTIKIKFKIPGIYSITLINIKGPGKLYKLSDNKSFDFYKPGEEIELFKINCRF